MKYNYEFFDGKFLPLVPLMIKGEDRWFEFKTFVDTGASYCLFHADVAQVLGRELEQGFQQEMILGDGNKIVVYIHKIPISIADVSMVIPIAFSKGIGTGFDIMGREGIFDHFVVSFHQKSKFIEFAQDL